MKRYYLIGLSLLLLACQSNQKEEKTVQQEPQKTIAVPTFSADSAYQYIAQQVDFGARVPNTVAHRQCAIYLEQTLKRFGAETTVQKATLTAFDGTKLNAQNIIGSYHPSAKTRILLFAHWDTRPWADHDTDPKNYRTPIQGANDGASGVGVLLEVARQLGKKLPMVGVDIIFFDAEDYGAPSHLASEETKDSWCLGSQYWAINKHKPNYHARYGILLDMVGAKNATFYRENYSEEFAKHVVDKVWSKAISLGFGKYFINQNSSWITDDHYYINQIGGIPSIDIIQYDKQSSSGFGEYWHTRDDTMKNIDAATLNAVGTTLLHVLYHEE